MTDGISRTLALRIGLAARVLAPEITLADLVALLDDVAGAPLSAEKLGSLTVKSLRKAAGGRLMTMPAERVKEALACLQGAGAAAPDDPEIQPLAPGDMPHSLRIACASNGGELLDGHFGSCDRFLVYQVSVDAIRLIDIRSCDGASEAEDKNAWRAALISDCQVVEMISIGGPAAAKVVRAGIHPLKRAQAGNARDAMAELQAAIAGEPAPWLARAMGLEARSLAPFLEGAST